jgi:hypothetical protein
MQAKSLKIPLNDPHLNPEWAVFSRRGGDRTAILFDDLRLLLGRIQGALENRELIGLVDFSPARAQSIATQCRFICFTSRAVCAAQTSSSGMRMKFPLSGEAQVRSFAVLAWLNRKAERVREIPE